MALSLMCCAYITMACRFWEPVNGFSRRREGLQRSARPATGSRRDGEDDRQDPSMSYSAISYCFVESVAIISLAASRLEMR